MAKLSARGRTEVFRLVKETTSFPPGSHEAESKYTWLRYTRCLMSDNKVLTKTDWKMETLEPWQNGTYGTSWTVVGTLKEGLTPDTWRDMWTARGYAVK